MFSWLIAAEAFRIAYPAARRGQKVAYLTLAGFLFLLFTLGAFMRADSVHGAKPVSETDGNPKASAQPIANWPITIANCRYPMSRNDQWVMVNLQCLRPRRRSHEPPHDRLHPPSHRG
jgi:hypothetical protein